jgi:hypothetical protein
MKGEPMNENPLGEAGVYKEGRGHTVSMMRPKALEIDHAELSRMAKAAVDARFGKGTQQEADPHGRDPHTPGAKLDAGKPSVVEHFLHYFPRAILAVTEVSDVGAKKYTSRGWIEVPNGFRRYSDGLGRHLVAESYEERDSDTGLLHAAQVAWNAMARLELKLIELEKVGEENS